MRFKDAIMAAFILCGSMFAQENSKTTVNIKVRLIKGSSFGLIKTGENQTKPNILLSDVVEEYNSENKIKVTHLQKYVSYMKKVNPDIEITAQTANYVELDTRRDDVFYVRIDHLLSSSDNISSKLITETLAVSLVYN